MLQALRDHSGKWFFRLFFVLIALSFLAAGVVGAVRNYHAARSVAKIGEKSVPFDQYVHILERTIREIRAKDTNLTLKDFKRMNLFQSILDEQIQDLIMTQELEKHKIFVPNDAIEGVIRSLPFFHKDGIFQQSLFEQYLQNSRTSEVEFVQRIRRHLMIQQIMKSLGDNIHIPQNYLNTLLNILFKNHIFEVMEIPFEKLKIDVLPTEENLQEIYQKNQKKYKVDERRDVKILSFQSSDLIKKIQISDEELKVIYEKDKDKFQEPEQRHIHKVTYPSKTMADSAYQYLKKGGDLATLFIHIPGGVYKDLGTITKDKAPQEFSHILFTSQEGVLPTMVSKENNEISIFHISSIQKAHIKSFNDVKEKLRHEIQIERSVEFIDEFRNKLEDELGAGGSLDSIAEKHKLVLTPYAVNPSGQSLSSFEKEHKDILLKEIFTLSPSQMSPVQEIGSGKFFVIQLMKVVPSYIPRLEDIKKKVKEDWILEKQKEKAQSYIKKFSDLSSKNGRKQAKGMFVSKERTIRQIDILTGKLKDFPDYAIKHIFSLKAEKMFSFEKDKKMILVWYKKTNPLSSLPKEADQIGKKIMEGQRDKDSFILQAMEKNYKKEIYQDVVEESYAFFK